jgi:hypothetical protein
LKLSDTDLMRRPSATERDDGSAVVERYRVLAADATEVGFAALLYQHIDDAPSPLLALYCRSAAEICRAMEPLSRRAGYAIYQWTNDRGLISLREDGMVVPASRRVAEALRVIQQSTHFGVYLIPVAGDQLTPPVIAQLRQIVRSQEFAVKRIVLLSETADLPASLTEYCAHLQLQPRSQAKLRLRDGHWVR